MSDLLKESIADAKAVRETAIANAKTFLEENFAQSMKQMFAEKLREDSAEEQVEVAEGADESPEAIEELNSSNIGKEKGNEASKQHPVKPAKQTTTKVAKLETDATMEEGTEITSEELDEILAELEKEGTDQPVITEDGPDGLGDVNLEPEVNNEPAPAAAARNEINIDELLAELEAEGQAPAPAAPVAPAPEAQVDPVTGLPIQQAPSAPAPVAPVQGQAPSLSESDDEDADDITPEEMAEALVALNEENETLKTKLAEANDGLKYIKGVLEESNLLNAKLLYTNKLFKGKNLTEEQKSKVINTFDLTRTLREIKIAYTVLAESYNAGGSIAKKKSNATVTTITEGLASKPVSSTRPGSIVETQPDAMTSRFQLLAGITK